MMIVMIGMIEPRSKDRITKEEVTMRFVFTTLIFSACSLVFGQDAAQMPSVLNHGQKPPAVADASAAEVATPVVVTPAAPASSEVVVVSKPRCRNGRCCATPDCRLYDVEESVSESCRPRLLGGYVKRNTARTVYRPSRR